MSSSSESDKYLGLCGTSCSIKHRSHYCRLLNSVEECRSVVTTESAEFTDTSSSSHCSRCQELVPKLRRWSSSGVPACILPCQSISLHSRADSFHGSNRSTNVNAMRDLRSAGAWHQWHQWQLTCLLSNTQSVTHNNCRSTIKKYPLHKPYP